MRRQKAACMTGRQTERTQSVLSVLYFGFESWLLDRTGFLLTHWFLWQLQRTIMWSTIHREVETAVFCRKMVESRREDTLTSLNGKPSQRLRKRWMDWKPMHVSFVDIIRIVFRYQHTVMPVPREQNRFLQQDRMPRLHWKWEDGVLIQGGLWKSWHREGIWQFIYSLNICINNMKFWFRQKCRWIRSVNGMDH